MHTQVCTQSKGEAHVVDGAVSAAATDESVHSVTQ